MNVDNRGERISKTNCIFFVIITKKKVHNLLYFSFFLVLYTKENYCYNDFSYFLKYYGNKNKCVGDDIPLQL